MFESQKSTPEKGIETLYARIDELDAEVKAAQGTDNEVEQLTDILGQFGELTRSINKETLTHSEEYLKAYRKCLDGWSQALTRKTNILYPHIKTN